MERRQGPDHLDRALRHDKNLDIYAAREQRKALEIGRGGHGADH